MSEHSVESEKLLPCPFCGKPPRSDWMSGGESDDCGYWSVECCGAFAHEDSEEAAAKIWNTRASLTPATKPVAWQEVSDEDWQRALDCAMSCLRKPFHISRSSMDNAMQHAFGILSLRASPAVPAQVGREAFQALIVEAGWSDDHGGDHHEDDCPICVNMAKVFASLQHPAQGE